VSVDAGRLLCGFATVFDEDAVDGRRAHMSFEFRALLGDFVLPLWVNHFPQLTSAHQGVGRTLRFAMVLKPPNGIPRGLLMLAAFDANPYGDSALEVVRNGQFSGLSLGGNGRPEVSLTDRPAYENARVLGVGQDAASVWELLTGSALDEPAVAS
jgi:hypothetical protein